MNRHFARSLTLAALLLTSAALARPLPKESLPTPADGPTPWLRMETVPNKAAVDTLYLLGGPDRLDGSFENAAGEPDWHGWTHSDGTVPEVNHWHVSQYWAYGINGHGEGNHALVCVDETLPACTETDTLGGVASGMFDNVEWFQPVPNPNLPTTVRLTGSMHYDMVDAGWDFLELFVERDGDLEMLAQWTGSGDNEMLDYSVTLQPGEYGGAYGDHARLVFRVWSDWGWDDQDCSNPSHGACQIDDVSVYLNDVLATFDDFEPGSEVNWQHSAFGGVGDFAALRGNLPDADPCRQNTSVQVSFIDDGLVVPGVGPTYCESFCYGFGNYILNNDGGLLASDLSQEWFLLNHVDSPAIAVPAGYDGAQLEFDVYRDETLIASSAGIFFLWSVRSTSDSDPAALESAEWRDRNLVYYGSPAYVRFVEPVSDLIEPGAQWAQIRLTVNELGWVWGWNGSNGTPAPYFDNVAFKVWQPEGPQILVNARTNFQDAFPEQGALDAMDPASNSCRIDIARDLDSDALRTDLGDSLIANVAPLRKGASLSGLPQLHYVMKCNPVFDGVRPTAPDGGGLLRGTVEASLVYNHYNGAVIADEFAFDLPDSGWFFPGDRLRYYITATDAVGGDLRTAVWPADTTAVLDFDADSSYPRFAEIRALPNVQAPVGGEFPHADLLWIDDTTWDYDSGRWRRAFAELGFVEGIDFDVIRTRTQGSGSIFGLATSVAAAPLSGYQTILYAGGGNGYPAIAGDQGSHTDELLSDWLDQGGKDLLLCGDGLLDALYSDSPGSPLWPRLGVVFSNNDITFVNGGEEDLRIHPAAGNGILPETSSWGLYGICARWGRFDAISAGVGAFSLGALDVAGQTGSLYSAAVAIEEAGLGNRIASVPFDLGAVLADRDNPPDDPILFSARTLLLRHFLDWFGQSGSGDYSPVPELRDFAFRVGPNPFNPRTTIEFELPSASDVALDIYDVQGRRVRRLVAGPLGAGLHEKVWSGRDDAGRAVPSGVYFYRFSAGAQQRVGKLTLLK